MFRRLTPLLLLVFFAACNFQKVPKRPIADLPSLRAPDYTQLQDWASHPDKKDPGDRTPNPSIVENQAQAVADVFFIHPTTFFSDKHWNGSLDDQKLLDRTDSTAILHQASIFNGSCRVFAPRYRQLVYGGFFVDSEQEKQSVKTASEIAFKDVLAAFEHYWKNENDGRPLVIAGHSQGSILGLKLLQFKENDPRFRQQLVAAYLPGWSVKPSAFQNIPPCAAADDIHCFLSWCSYEWGAAPDDPAWYQDAYCVNPILWSHEPDSAGATDHDGLVMRDYNKLHNQVVSAKVNGNILWVTRPDVRGKWIIPSENFHIGDYNLFWLDVRNNVEMRVQAYVKGLAK